MKIRLRGLLAVLFLSAVALAAGIAVDANLYLDDIKFLASKELRGRASGSAELEQAAASINKGRLSDAALARVAALHTTFTA